MEKLNLFRKRVGCLNNKVVCFEHYQDFFDIYDETHYEDKEKFNSQFAKAYIELLEKTDGTSFSSSLAHHLDIFIDRTKDFIYSISSSIHNSVEAELVFIDFLNILLASQIDEEQDLFKKYTLFIDLAEKNSWIFGLEDKEAAKLFKISKILECSINTFEPDEQHLIQITLALQIFNSIPIQESREDVKLNKIKEIAQKHNITILEMLCDGHKLHGSEPYKNFLQNGTFICISSNKILIRNPDKEYFGVHPQIKEEINSNNEIIAYFVELEIKNFQKPVNFDVAMQKLQAKEKLTLLLYIFTTSSFNLFYDSIIIDVNENTFVDLVNPFMHNDNKIIASKVIDQQKNTLTQDFINLIKKEYPYSRTQTLYNNGTIDTLNLDFLFGFIQFVQVNKKDYTYLANFIKYLEEVKANQTTKKADFLQNILIYFYFDSLGNDFIKIIPSIKNYYKDFIKKYLYFNNDEISKEIRHEEDQILFYPYKFYIPFIDIYTDTYIEYLNQLYECNDFKPCEITNKQEVDINKYFIGENELDNKFTIQNLEKNKIHLNQLKSIRQRKAFVSVIKSKVILDDNAIFFLDIHIELCKLQNNFITTYDEKAVNCQKFSNILEIIKHIGINKKVLDFFGGYKEFQKESYNFNLERFKLLWHIQAYCKTPIKLELFYKLILDKHHNSFLTDKSIYKNYFRRVQALLEDSESLVVCKNTMSDISTLSVIESQENGLCRDLFKLTQTAEGVRKLSQTPSKSCKIKTIYFLTDNITSGGSTEKMLSFHFSDHKIENSHDFIDFENKNFLKSFLNDDMNNVKLLCLFCGSKSEENINKKIAKNNSYIGSIEVISEGVIDENKYFISNEVTKITQELYNWHTTGKFLCYFRRVNMPAKYVFPEHIVSTKNIVGLFEHRKENITLINNFVITSHDPNMTQIKIHDS